MDLTLIIKKELFERKSQLITCFLAIFLGIAAIVAIKNISFYSEKAVASQLDALGANIIILPKSVSVQSYYSADMNNDVIPEEYLNRLVMSNLEGLDNLSPKLSTTVNIKDKKCTLTGILPKSEFQAKAMWEGAGIFTKPAGCGAVESLFSDKKEDKKLIVRKRVIETLNENEILVGNDIASSFSLHENDQLTILGKSFVVSSVLPQTGTVDDSRIFAHLHTVQKLIKKTSVINAIEVVGCCNEISQGLVSKINKLLPEAKVVTISQIVDTQVKTNKMMSNLSIIFLIIIILLGGMGIANYMFSNINERKKEIGTLMALGAGSNLILKIFIFKAFLIGVSGGILGYIAGTLLAVTLGPKIARIPVLPMPELILWALGLSIGITLISSFFPARSATKIDPCICFQEI